MAVAAKKIARLLWSAAARSIGAVTSPRHFKPPLSVPQFKKKLGHKYLSIDSRIFSFTISTVMRSIRPGFVLRVIGKSSSPGSV